MGTGPQTGRAGQGFQGQMIQGGSAAGRQMGHDGQTDGHPLQGGPLLAKPG